MDTLLKKALDMRGLKVGGICREYGIPYNTVYQHVYGKRRMTADAALRYEEKLGIPRSELRPDLWPPNNDHPAIN